MSTTAPTRQLLTVWQTAERLTVSEKTVRRLISSGNLPALRVGAQLRVDADELERWLYADRP
jgi:excisionase family DNA binding protein